MCGTLHFNSGHVGAAAEGRLRLALCWWVDGLRGSPELWETDGLYLRPASPVSCGPGKEQVACKSLDEGWMEHFSLHTVSIRTKLPPLMGPPDAPVIKAALKKAVEWSMFMPWYNSRSGLMREQ